MKIGEYKREVVMIASEVFLINYLHFVLEYIKRILKAFKQQNMEVILTILILFRISHKSDYKRYLNLNRGIPE